MGLINAYENSEEVMDGMPAYAEIHIVFQDETEMRVCPTWWGPGSMIDFHYSDTAEDDCWLDSDDDKGTIEGEDEIEATLDLIEDYRLQHERMRYVVSSLEIG